MTSWVFSQCVLPSTSGLSLVNTVFHDTVFDVLTKTVVLVVDLVTGDASSIAKVSAVRRTVPVQSALSYSVNDTEPFRAVPPVDVNVAESFGSQFCAEVPPVESLTVKHSPVLASLEPV
jgi:hypothetical protein